MCHPKSDGLSLDCAFFSCLTTELHADLVNKKLLACILIFILSGRTYSFGRFFVGTRAVF